MPNLSISPLGDNPSNAQIQNYLIKLERDLEWLLSNLDDMNINRLTAGVIKAGTLDAELVTIRANLTSGYIQLNGEGMTVNNGVFDTFKVSMMGEVEMTRALIRSSLTYPLIEFDSTNGRIRAMYSATMGISIAPGDSTDPPSLTFLRSVTSTVRQYISNADGGFNIETNSNIDIKSNAGRINIGSSLTPYGVYFQSWSDISSIQQGKSLSTVFSEINSSISSRAMSGVSTGSAGSHNHGISNGTELMTVGGGSVTWFAANNHSHTQI